MQVEIREFPQGISLEDHTAGKSVGDPGVVKRAARRSWVMVDGRCVAHIGWEAADLVFITPVSKQEQEAAINRCREEFEGEVTSMMASPSFEEPTDRRKKRKVIVPGQSEDDE